MRKSVPGVAPWNGALSDERTFKNRAGGKREHIERDKEKES